MKKIFILVVLIFPCFNSGAITSEIDKVTLYRTGAYVERAVRIPESKEVNKIIIEDLPPELDDNSVVVEGEGINVLEVKIIKKQMPEVYSERLKELKAKLKDLEEKEKTARDEINVVQAKIDYFINLSKSLSSNLPGEFFKKRFDTKEYGEVVRFVSEGLNDALSLKRSLEKKEENIKTEIDKVKREIDDIQSPEMKFKKNIEVLFSSDKRTNTKIRVSYFRGGATWQPVYRIDSDPESGSIHVTMKAEVIQSGGEDWRNAELLFSTAEPSIYGTPPKPTPWVIDFEPEYPPLRPVQKKEIAPSVMAPLPEEIPPEAKMAFGIPPPAVEERGIAYIFRTPTRVDVPSDNMPHTFDIISKKLEAEFRYRIFPDYSPFAYLMGEATLPEDLPVIGGRLILFQRGAYVGEASSEFTSGGEKLKLPTGVDRNLSVEKKLLRKKIFDEGVFSKETRVNQAYQIIFRNPYSRNISVEVLCRIPVSRHEDIKVKIVKITPDAEINETEGFLTWKVSPERNEKVELYYEFDVTYPRGKRVGGL